MKIFKEQDFSYTLRTLFKKEVGCIDAVCSNNQVEIIRFCVAVKYRGHNKRYGKQLLDCIIADTTNNNINYILVCPKAEELYDNVKQMELSDLYRKYSNLGFKFNDIERLRAFGNMMRLDL